MAPLLEERAHRLVDRSALDARADDRDRELERLDALRVPFAERRIGLADAERPRHVREARALEVLREEVAEDGVVVVDPPAARVVPVGAPAAPCATIMSSPRQPSVGERRRGGRPSSSQVSGSPSTIRPPSPAPSARSSAAIAAIPASAALCADADARELEVGLAPPPVVEEPLVDDELDAVGPQPVADAEREALGHDRLLDAERRHHLREQRREDLVGIEPVAREAGRAGRSRPAIELDRRVDR